MLIKRLFDLIASSVGLLILWPVMIIIAFVIVASSKGPILFKQKRVGKGGILFSCYKFRTMINNSEKHGTVTVASDARITSVGKFLRKYKLDELPQLWNVLIGKMSFVGPRPDVPGYADMLKGEDAAVMNLRPGITGPATLFFRNEEELLTMVDNPRQFNDTVLWPLKVKINLQYLKNWKFKNDIGYILITLFPLLNIVLKLAKTPPKTPIECVQVLTQFTS
jgi:lipopolysaccharide/colanic/teichoic acid biosynthesis glycosyltransferase